MLSNISQGITDKIVLRFPETTKQEAEEIEYGLYMFIDAYLVKIPAIILISYFLGLLLYASIAVTVFVTLRWYIGGIHGKSHLECFLVYAAVVVIVSYLSINYNLSILNFIIFPLSLILAYKYAPADLPCKPINSKMQRRSLRRKSITLLAFYFFVTLLAPWQVRNVITLTTMVVVFMITPIAYSITNNQRTFNWKEGE